MLLVSKSRAACLSAIETYNRASSLYREETFAILMINAWELLLKARIMRENGGKVSSLHEFKPRKRKDGSPSKFREVKLTRSGAPMTIGLERCCNLVASFPQDKIDKHCIANIEALLEIRDSATHFIATDALLRKALTEISLASVKNYVTAAQKWFSVSFSDLNIASIPISFDLDQREVEAIAKKSPDAVVKFLAHMQKVDASLVKGPSDFNFTVRVDFDLIKKKDGAALQASIVRSDADITVAIEGDKVPPGFSWTYDDLVAKLKERYDDFKQNTKFHNLMKPIKLDKKLHYERYLDPERKKGGKKSFFNPNAIKEFDAHYQRKGATLFDPENAII
ncbi:DUF3644 domain-containing protein [Sandaracinobacteroides sp. A072]|uniref:DUF3644 domain-containing protein n=1 Tax=Sandaracinobacteroides sp. A072 TaxID=3461146 RepID=UPI004042DB9B